MIERVFILHDLHLAGIKLVSVRYRRGGAKLGKLLGPIARSERERARMR